MCSDKWILSPMQWGACSHLSATFGLIRCARVTSRTIFASLTVCPCTLLTTSHPFTYPFSHSYTYVLLSLNVSPYSASATNSSRTPSTNQPLALDRCFEAHGKALQLLSNVSTNPLVLKAFKDSSWPSALSGMRM